VPSEHYTKHYYEIHRNGVSRSAEVIVPLVLQLLPVRSVVDVGCGDGSWLSIFRKLGVDDILGIDGDYVTRDFLQIAQDHFQAIDLTKPFALGRVFDLAISLEVAEHLPAECAAAFIESLTRLAPFVLFSAAIPFQGGDCHINEQWQDKWVELFQRHSYVPIDFIRKRVWQNEAVYWWYSQNTLLYAHADLIQSNPALKAEFERTNADQLCLVHPRQYLSLHSLYQETLTRAQQLIPPPSGLKEASRIFMVCLKNAIRWRLDRIGQKEAAATAEPNPANRPPRGRL
jgi:SAM-dependent methyltransferase